jgi:hypothetical protein
MKNTPLYLLIIMLSNTIFSQTIKSQEAFEKFTEQYNSGAFESIYDNFSVAMQNALPLANAKDFFGGLSVQAGKITASSFEKMQGENTSFYKTTFDRGVFEIQISEPYLLYKKLDYFFLYFF